jgi:hypothetical protein
MKHYNVNEAVLVGVDCASRFCISEDTALSLVQSNCLSVKNVSVHGFERGRRIYFAVRKLISLSAVSGR